jgi:hypothetical protein
VAATNASYPLWIDETRALAAQHGHVFPGNVPPQIAADGEFLSALRHVHFTGAARDPAAQLEFALGDYITQLLQFEKRFDTRSLVAVHDVSDQRAADSAQLRRALGLPAATCEVLRP